MTKESAEIFYAEDDAADADFAQIAFNEIGKGKIKLQVVQDGEEALHLLGKVTPTLIILDLNLPKVSGKELLKNIRKSNTLNKTPVLILSTSENQQDIDDVYRLGASGYFSKPANFADYKGIFQTISDYWLEKAQLPSTTSKN